MAPSVRNKSWDMGGKQKIHGINHLVPYLCGKGDMAYQADGGTKFQESKETGKKLCDALNAEAEIFYANVFNGLGNADKKLLIDALYGWLAEQCKKSIGADKEDLKFWSELRDFADKESEALGVIIQ